MSQLGKVDFRKDKDFLPFDEIKNKQVSRDFLPKS